MTAPFLPQETIRTKRDGGRLSGEEIAAFIAALADGSLSEGQAAAFAMAVYFKGMAAEETVALTQAMTRSGRTLAWPKLDRPRLDKHSTGGVGDKVSLILAPILAACGAAVPMISGRGLGHTGGTLDKLDAIPGYDTAPSLATFGRVVQEAGCAIVGQTDDLAPADRRLYAIRDVTATVDSIPLITASILSKKLAAGLSALVMDVKVGSGAFMQNEADARALAESIVAVANGAGLPTRALITDMDQVLGRKIGNALEVEEALDHLTGTARGPRLHEVVVTLCAELLVMGGLADGVAAATEQVEGALADGSAAEAFAAMAAALGGPVDLLDRTSQHLPQAPYIKAVPSPQAGFLAEIDVRAVGMAVVALGGGRTHPAAPIDHRVGFSDVAAIGESVDAERPLALVHARSQADAETAISAFHAAVGISEDAPFSSEVIRARVVS